MAAAAGAGIEADDGVAVPERSRIGVRGVHRRLHGACDLVEPLGRSQPTVSHHLSMLVDAGFLTREKRGKWAWYRVVPERLAALQAALAP